MRTIVTTLVLMMLIGGYGAAQTEDPAQASNRANMERQEGTERQEATATEKKPATENQPGAKDQADMENEMVMEEVVEMEEATNDFLGLKWGAGIGVIGGFGGDKAVETASIDANSIVRVDEEGELRPQVFLEMHAFVLNKKARHWRKYQQWLSETQMKAARETEMRTEKPKPTPPLMGFGPFVALQSSDNEAIDALTFGVMLGVRRNPKKAASVNIGIGLSFDPSVQVLGGGMRDGQMTSEEAVRFKKESRFGWALMASFTF